MINAFKTNMLQTPVMHRSIFLSQINQISQIVACHFILLGNILSCKPSNFRKRVRKVINKAKLRGDHLSEVKELWLNERKDLWQYVFHDCCLVYSIFTFINTTLYNCSCDCFIFILCSVFIVCVVLCTVFRLIVVLFCVMCVVCVLCLIVVPLLPGENPFAVKINISIYNTIRSEFILYSSKYFRPLLW
jgi:hypothetical protein